MKRITAIALFMISGFFIVDGVLAQDHAVQATVPFDFTVGGRLLPSGTYTITPVMSRVIEIQDRNEHVSIFTPTTDDSKKSQGNGKLVFKRYGGQYFLSEILCEPASLNVRLISSKSEKRARMQEARLDHGASQVLVAAK